MQLEGLRGIAAIMVVGWHFVWAFMPWELGSVAGLPSNGLLGNPVIASIDGPAAVALFFVLSGFVLPLGFFRSGRTRTAARAAAKRWLRLAGLSVVATLLSYALFRMGLFHYHQAARITGSQWLGSYGGAHPNGTFDPSLGGAVQEGLVGAFVNNADVYNPVLWTMRHELFGSFLSLGLALVLWNARTSVCIGVLAVCAVLAPLVNPWLIPFVVGTGLAYLFWTHGTRMRWGTAATCIAAGLYLFGYLQPTGAYAGIPVIQDGAGFRYDRILLHTLSALLIILGLIGNDRVSRLLTARPFLVLARISFPIYLLHFPLLCSVACGLFLLFQPGAGYSAGLALAAAIYALLVFVVGYLFARADEWWAVSLNRFTDLLAARTIGLARGFQQFMARRAEDRQANG
jgi:peptidoglycan/LPS O-acetylase OafA/YrhL